MISVIIPTKDRSGMLLQCLNGLYCQDASHQMFDVVVVDDGSSYDVAELVRCHPLSQRVSTTVLRNPSVGAAAARNAAVARSKGDIVAFLDDDAVPAPDWISVIQASLPVRPPNVVALTGRILPLQENLFSDARQARYDDRRTNALGREGNLVNFLAAGNSAIFRSTFERLGGFDTRCTMMHDRELVLRLSTSGKMCAYEDRMVIHHMHVKELGDAFVNAFRSGGYRRVLEAIHPVERVSVGRDLKIIGGLISKAVQGGPAPRYRGIALVNCLLHTVHFAGYLTLPRKRLPPADFGQVLASVPAESGTHGGARD